MATFMRCLMVGGGLAAGLWFAADAQAGNYGVDAYYVLTENPGPMAAPRADAARPMMAQRYGVDDYYHARPGQWHGGWSTYMTQSNWYVGYPRYGVEYHPRYSHGPR